MSRRTAIVLLALATLCGAVATAAEPHVGAAIVRQRRTLHYVRELTDMGPRLTGTPGLERAAAWAVQQLRAAGVDDVRLEPFTIADGWQRERASGRIFAPIEQTLHVASLGWTPSTPEGGVVADVVSIETTTAEQVVASASRVRGRIVLLPADEAFGAAAAIAERHHALDAALRDAGALAILSAEPDGRNVLSARDRSAGAAISLLPAAQIGADDVRTLRRLLDRGAVRVALELLNRVTAGPVPVSNVVGELRGRDPEGEWVIVG